MKNVSWKIWNAAACVTLCVGTAQARTMWPIETGQPSPAVYAPAGEGQTHDDLLDGLERLGANAKEKNEVNLDKNMMALTAGRRGGRYADLSSKMDLITVRNYEFNSKGMYSRSDLDSLRKKLDSNGWSHVVRNESDGESNDIAIKATGDGYISDMVILNVEAKEINIVHMRGHFHMDDVNSAMGATMGISHGAGAGAMSVLGPLGGSSSHTTSSTTSSNGNTTHTVTTSSHHGSSETTPPPPSPPSPPSPPAPASPR